MIPYIVVPTIRESSIVKFLKEWDFPERCVVMVVEDNPTKQFNLPQTRCQTRHLCHLDIDEDLGENSRVIPRKTDCVRSYGFLKAWSDKAEFVITLDDDCYPLGGMSGEEFISEHRDALNNPVRNNCWVSSIYGVTPRGVPYANLEKDGTVLINHGLWEGVPDLDAITQIGYERIGVPDVSLIDKVIPRGMFYPMCGMNVSFHTHAAPMMYFLLMGKEHGRDRWGDIWCGVFSKKICDHLGYFVKSGGPYIYHSRASNMWANLEKESTGYFDNEILWERVDDIILTSDTIVGCYEELAEKLQMSGEYWFHLKKAMLQWTKLF